MFVNVLGVDLWEQPIPKRWKADVFSGYCFLMGRVLGLCILGLVRLIWVEPTELSDFQVAQFHASRLHVKGFSNSCTRSGVPGVDRHIRESSSIRTTTPPPPTTTTTLRK